MDENEVTMVNTEMIGQNFTDSQGVEWIWDEEEMRHTMKYVFDENEKWWYKLNTENWTYEPLIELHQPKPTAEMGKYGSMRLNFIWQTPCLLEIMLTGNTITHCEEMNEKVLQMIEKIVEKKKQSEEYKEIAKSGDYMTMVQTLEMYRMEAEEEVLPVTVYAI